MQDFIPKQIDINQSIGTVTVKQYDNNSRFLHITISDSDLSDVDSNAFIMQDCSASLYIQPEGSSDPDAVHYVAGEIADAENGVVTFLLPGSVTRNVGRYECEIWINQGDEQTHPIISTKPFLLIVEKSIRRDDAIMALESYSAFDAQMIRVEALQSQMNGLVASPAGSGGDVGTELRNIRVGWDGTEYTCAGDAVRSQAETAVKGTDRFLDTAGWAAYGSNFNALPNNIVVPCGVDNTGGIIGNAPYAGYMTGLILTFGRKTARSDGDVQTFVPEDGGAVFYRQYNARGGSSNWKEWKTVYENVPQFRPGINDLFPQYHSHIYEYTKEGTFYATQTASAGGAIVRRWSDLPTQDDSPYIITNTRYGANWILQTAVKADSLDAVYNRVEPIVPSANEQVTSAWTRIQGDHSGLFIQSNEITEVLNG